MRKGTVDAHLQRIVVGMSDRLPFTELAQGRIGLLQWVNGKTGGIEAAKNDLPIRRRESLAKSPRPVGLGYCVPLLMYGTALPFTIVPGGLDVVSFREMNTRRADIPEGENSIPKELALYV